MTCWTWLRRCRAGYAGYVYGDSTAGQKVLYRVGMTGIPIVNVNNNCSTARPRCSWPAGGRERCRRLRSCGRFRADAARGARLDIRGSASPFSEFDRVTDELVGHDEIPLALRYFASAGKEHMEKHGTKLSTFAKIRAKATVMPRGIRLRCPQGLTQDDVMQKPVIGRA